MLRMPLDRVAPWMLRLSCTSEGGRRGRGAPLLTWSRLVKKEGWDRIPWAEIKIRKPLWKGWTEGGWVRVLETVAADRAVWRDVVDSVVGELDRATRFDQVGWR